MTRDKNSFIRVHKSIKLSITIEDWRTLEVISEGMISMKAKNCSIKHIQMSYMALASAKSMNCGLVDEKRLYCDLCQ